MTITADGWTAPHLHLCTHTAGFDRALSQFEAAVDALNLPSDLHLGLLNFALHLIGNGHAIKFDCVLAPSRNEATVFAHPSERFLGLMAAVGAGEREGDAP